MVGMITCPAAGGGGVPHGPRLVFAVESLKPMYLHGSFYFICSSHNLGTAHPFFFPT